MSFRWQRFCFVSALLPLATPAVFSLAQGQAAPLQLHAAAHPPALSPLPMVTGGRMLTGPAARDAGFPAEYTSQWPGSYFRTAFAGPEVYLRVGSGSEILHVVIDGSDAVELTKPLPGVYELEGLDPGPHTLEVRVATESQAGPDTFGGFAIPAGERAMKPARHVRQIEFVGDSHTVGYGDLSATRRCTPEEIWAETDDTKAFGAVTARHYDAEYQVNAISGRGVVRNYNGFAAPTLPEAYPYVLFDRKQLYRDPDWHPEVVAIALGTNDFSTALNPGERWKTREALHADFEATYLKFLQGLRVRDPGALIVVWATDVAKGEVEAEGQKVVTALQRRGDGHIVFVPIDGLQFSACDAHPSLADEGTIASRLIGTIDADTKVWATANPLETP